MPTCRSTSGLIDRRAMLLGAAGGLLASLLFAAIVAKFCGETACENRALLSSRGATMNVLTSEKKER